MSNGKIKPKLKKSITILEDDIKYIEDEFQSTSFSKSIGNLIKNHKKLAKENNKLSERVYKSYQEILFNQEIILDMLNSFSLDKELDTIYHGDKIKNPSHNYSKSFEAQRDIREKEFTRIRNNVKY